MCREEEAGPRLDAQHSDVVQIMVYWCALGCESVERIGWAGTKVC